MSYSSAISLLLLLLAAASATGDDNNPVHSPCEDATVRKKDGFTLGLAFAPANDSFYNNHVQLSPCDSRLGFGSKVGNVMTAVFRPSVDQISLLTVNTTTFPAVFGGMYMVAFAGKKYAARSRPTFVGNSTYIVTGFTLVLEFQKGKLQNLYWKKDGCAPCSSDTNFKCLESVDGKECAILSSKCRAQGGKVDCSLGIQLAFSGTDKSDRVLNSWYEVSKLRQYSLYGLFSDLKDSLTSQFNNFF